MFGYGHVGSFVESNDMLSAVTVDETRKKLDLTKEQNCSIDVVAADSVAQAAEVIRFCLKQHRKASDETNPGDPSKNVQSTFDVIQADDQQFREIVSKRIAEYLAQTSERVNEILTDIQKTQLQSLHYALQHSDFFALSCGTGHSLVCQKRRAISAAKCSRHAPP